MINRTSPLRILSGLALLAAAAVVALRAAGPAPASRKAAPPPVAKKKVAGSLMQLFREGMYAQDRMVDFHGRDGSRGQLEQKPEDCLTQELGWRSPVTETGKVRQLLDEGADVNERDDRMATPLIYAAASSTRDVVRLLLERGARVNDADKFGETALLVAVYDRERFDIARDLIDHGAAVNLVSVYGETALAKSGGKGPMVHLLLSHGAKVDGHALTYAAYGADLDSPGFLEMLDTGVDVDLKGDEGRTALMCAAYSDNIPLIKELLRRGAKADVIDDEGFGIIQYSGAATSHKNREVVRLLREAGARR